ncbi:MAG: HAD-IIB family hydrolase [Ruminococcaceae bacterium]|nr:HAD-IIB family hydrolase [Oscillospiraceae bacterium]
MINTENVCYLLFDFDGTVFLKGQIPMENSVAIAAAQRLGHQVILNTGRSRAGLDFSNPKYDGVRWDGMIFGTSDMTYRGRWDHAHHLTAEKARAWTKYAMEKRIWIALEGELENLRLNFDLGEDAPDVNGAELVWCEVEALLKRTPLTKLSVAWVDSEAPVTDESVIVQKHYAEILPKGRDKGAAFLDFCRIHHVDPEQCVCFGDSLNDLAVFQVCPTSVCMRHGHDELKKVATYCAEGDFGVAEGLKWLFGNNLDLTNETE